MPAHKPRLFSYRKLLELPKDAIAIDRCGPWGNPFVIGKDGARDEVIAKYREWIFSPEQEGLRERAKRELRGADLICWCAPLPCHGDVLMEIANKP